MDDFLRGRPLTYQLVKTIGQGSSARVYEAYRQDAMSGFRQRVALKFLHSKNEVEKLRQEFSSLCRVQSPHCVRLLSFEQLEGRPVLVLEFVDGVTLSQLIQHCHLSRALAAEIVAQIQRGLRDLQKVSLCHGDLSVDNVLVDIQGQVRLIDFGLANFSDRCNQMTPMFAAPEVLKGKTMSLAADLFALGILEGLMLRKWSLEGLHEWNPGRYCQRGHSYLAPEPQNRTWRQLKPSQHSQRGLAEKVAKVKKHLAQSGQHTMVCPSAGLVPAFRLKKARPLLSRSAILGMVLASLVWLSGSSPQSSAHVQAQIPSFIEIRSLNWLWYRLEPLGKKDVRRLQGYSPLGPTTVAPGRYQLHYRTAQGEGSLALTILPGENKVLQEANFAGE